LIKLRKLFNPLPGNHYLHVTTEVDEISFLLDEMMQAVGGKFNLAIYSKNILHVEKPTNANIQHIQDFNHPFRALPREHDIVVIKDTLHAHQNPKMILKLAYTTLANSANIVIIEKKGVVDIEALKAMLEEHEFRAPNEIDIIDGYDLVVAKKMHMWGAGL